MNSKEREILRSLASRVSEIASEPVQEVRRKRWHAHNRLEHGKALVFCSPEGSWRELIPERELQIDDPMLRSWEKDLRMRIYTWEHFADDQATDRDFKIGYVFSDTGWGAGPQYIHSGAPQGAYRWEPPMKRLEEIDKLHFPEVTIDKETTRRNLNIAQELFGDILNVQLCGRFWWAAVDLAGEITQLRGIQQVMLDMYDNPKWTHCAMRFLMEGRMQWLQSFKDEGILCLNNGNDYVGSGGFGFSEELPSSNFDGKYVDFRDMWGFGVSQEFSEVSPAMHDEFLLQYQIPILEWFGLNCYGCCEPLHTKLDIVKKIPRLRRISISPWCNRTIAAEALQDKYIYSWKPNPAHIAAVNFDPEYVRSYIRETLDITRGCIVEMILKDTHTCNNDPVRFNLWTQIAQEESERAVRG